MPRCVHLLACVRELLPARTGAGAHGAVDVVRVRVCDRTTARRETRRRAEAVRQIVLLRAGSVRAGDQVETVDVTVTAAVQQCSDPFPQLALRRLERVNAQTKPPITTTAITAAVRAPWIDMPKARLRTVPREAPSKAMTRNRDIIRSLFLLEGARRFRD